MNRVYGAGFTIIEVMLFLAVSGALAVGILASAQMSINEQRYRDTITSVQNKIQSQYNQTAHVVNFREDGEGPCGARRGASNCVMLGRLVQISNRQIVSSSIVASPSTDANSNGVPDELEDELEDDYDTEEYFGLYSLQIAPESTETYDVPWQSEISNVNSTTERQMLILRSPETGLVYTYSNNVSVGSTNYGALINTANRVERKLCIPRNGWGNSNNLGVIVRANANSASAIELMTDGDVCP